MVKQGMSGDECVCVCWGGGGEGGIGGYRKKKGKNDNHQHAMKWTRQCMITDYLHSIQNLAETDSSPGKK